MNLTEHFTIEELTRTDVRNLRNDPPELAIARLRDLSENILEAVRRHFVAPVVIHSAYRSPAVNDAVRGSKTSQHMRGEAADFHVSGVDFFTVARWIASSLEFDQLILEFCDPSGFGRGWVHCSYVGYKPNRRRITVASNLKGVTVYRDILATDIPRAIAA
jgi:zinc D-Ala-D-Ala carboxypeptidase